jgi:peptide-methionine (S)-S-oxide reductase
VKDELQSLHSSGKIPGYGEPHVVTAILDATVFYPAHEEHQEYLDKYPGGYCNHRYRFYSWPSL